MGEGRCEKAIDHQRDVSGMQDPIADFELRDFGRGKGYAGASNHVGHLASILSRNRRTAPAPIFHQLFPSTRLFYPPSSLDFLVILQGPNAQLEISFAQTTITYTERFRIRLLLLCSIHVYGPGKQWPGNGLIQGIGVVSISQSIQHLAPQ